MHFAGCWIDAGDESGVTPKESQISHCDGGGHVVGLSAQLVSQFGFGGCRVGRRFDGDHEIAASTTAAGTKDFASRHDGRAAASFVKCLAIGPKDGSCVRIQSADAFCFTVADQLVTAGCIGVDTGGGIGCFATFAVGFPDPAAACFIQSDERACSHLVVGDDQFVFVKHGRDADAVLTFEGAEIFFPQPFASVIQSCGVEMTGCGPENVYPVGVHCHTGGGEAVEIVFLEGFVVDIPRPEDVAVGSIDRKDVECASVFVHAGQEDGIFPQDGRRVSFAGQIDLPNGIFKGELA